MVTRSLLLASALAACGSDEVVINIVIDGPAPGSPAAAFPDLDTVEISVALAGDPLPLASQTFRRGEDISLPNIPYGENLVIHMIGRIGNQEVAAGRTCPFAVRTNEDPPSPHLYFAKTVKWAEVGASPTSGVRDGGSALTDAFGNGLYIGGVDPTALPISGIDRFDTMQGVFEEVANIEPRRNSDAAPLGDGRIVIVGGTTNAGLPAANLELVDLAPLEKDRRVTKIPADPALVGTFAPALAATTDGRVVAFGGTDGDGVPINQIIDMRPAGASIEQRQLLRAKLAIARQRHTATRLSDDLGAPILVIGGVDSSNAPIGQAELYKPLLEEMVSPMQFAPIMNKPRRDHEAVRLPDGSVLVVGGRGPGPEFAVVRELEIFTFDSGFQIAGTLPGAAGVTDFTLTPLPDGSILLAGGRDAANNPVNTSFIIRLNPTDGELDVVTTDPLTSARSRHQATLLCDGTVMLVGGTLFATPAERYNPLSTGRR